uniref:Uncharacterized protein n=1 Tax=Glossina pallidipes TaxID=7398 RepID=A0A1A9Z6L3_GLOPL
MNSLIRRLHNTVSPSARNKLTRVKVHEQRNNQEVHPNRAIRSAGEKRMIKRVQVWKLIFGLIGKVSEVVVAIIAITVIRNGERNGILSEHCKARKRLQFSNLEKVSQRKRLFHHYRVLKRQIRHGRRKWVQMISEDGALEVRNLLAGNKGMQRLYQTMSLNQIVDNINQRTFTLRKERDRLTARLENLKAVYEKALRVKSEIENRNKYHDFYVLDEQFKSYEKKKLLVNSKTRLAAIKTINGSYQKIIAILRHDEIFYEPILNSLDRDILDQENFIKHILHLGSPAIARFSELSEDFRKQQEMARKRTLAMTELVTKLRSNRKRSSLFQTFKNVDGGHKGGGGRTAAIKSPFVRETISMLVMKTELKAIEETIKKIKFATFCSKSTEIYRRMKGQVEYNYQLRKRLENDDLGLEALETKVKCASVLRDVLIDNITDEGDRRLRRVKLLGEAIEAQDKYQAAILDYMKNRAKAFVLFRYSLWNIHDILRHVAPTRGRPTSYPNEYLKLPLLKFEMLTMRAVPPEVAEENISSLMKTAEKKLRALMLAFHQLRVKPSEVVRARADYQSDIYRQQLLVSETNSCWTKHEFIVAEEAAKAATSVPNRKQIKAQSAKLVEETAKRDE